MKPIAADSLEGRVLLALRAGPMDAGELAERFGYKVPVGSLIYADLITRDSEGTYRLTEAGRAACPFRNPLAARAATPPEVFTMPKGETKLTRQQVLAAIVAAGAPGISRRALIDKFAHLVTEQAIDMHITALNRQLPPVIFKPAKGVLCDIAFANETQFDPAEIAEKPASTAADDWVPEPLATDPPTADRESKPDQETGAAGIEPALAARDDELFKQAQVIVDLRRQLADKEYLAKLPTVVEDLDLDDPETVEFAIYSSGGLDIHSDDCSITLRAPVLSKLRAFLGLFREEAA